jgi:hypothetical protein
MRLRDFLIPIAIGTACLAVGWYVGGSGKHEDTQTAVSITGDGSVTNPPVASVMTDSQDCPQYTPPEEATEARAPGPSLPTREQAAASMQAHAVLDAAISRRTWTDEDADAFTAYFEELSAEEKIATVKKFTTAINQQAMKPVTDRMPF